MLKFGVPLVGPAPSGDAPMPDVCWAPGTSAATIAAFERRHIDNGFQLSPYRVLGQGRWERTATDGGGLTQGQPTTIRYSIVPDGTPIDGFGGEAAAPSNLQARLTQIYGNKDTWLDLFARVGQALSAQSGLTYVYEPNDDGAIFGPDINGDRSPGQIGVRGDVRVSGHTIDGDSRTLAYNYEPGGGGDMVIDTADDFYEDRRQNDLGVRNVITHEFGHGVGLGHTCPINETKLMEPTVSYEFDGPQFDDIRGLQRFYGDDLENDDTAAISQNLGALNNGTVNIGQDRTVSLDDAGDVDFFRFSTLANKSIGITLRPIGNPYLEGAQNEDGSCTPGTLLDPKTVNNLGFDLLKADDTGTFVSVATVDSTQQGGTETLDPKNFAGGGQFQIRVFGGAVKDVQTYAMDVTVGAPVTEPTPAPTPTVGPTPKPSPTGVPTPTPLPGPTAIRPIVDLNGLNDDEAQGQDSATPSGIDNTAFYDYRAYAIKPDGTFATKPDGSRILVGKGGAQFITPPETLVISDTSAQPVVPGKAIAEARVELTPDDSCIIDPRQPKIPDGIAPDNCNPQGKRDNEVLAIPGEPLKGINDFYRTNLSATYDVNTQILKIKGGGSGLDNTRAAYEAALTIVTYENKLPITDANSPFNRSPSVRDRIITYVVDTDNDDSNNQDNRFGFVDGPNSNPKQSKPAVLTLKFRELQSLIVTTNSDNSAANDNQTSLREAIAFANTIPFSNPDPDPNKPPVLTAPSIITFAPDVRGSINLTASLPAISNQQKTLTIQGPGARLLTVNGAGSRSGVFQVANSNVTISGLTISGGTAIPVGSNTVAYGGGIFNNNGILAVDACTISGNSAQSGGGIASIGGTLNLTNSTISGNRVSLRGGGLYLDNVNNGSIGSTTIRNSTISGNSGNGITQISGRSTTTLTTITNNAPAGVAVSEGTADFNNTIISGNASDNDVTNNGGNITSGGYNVVGGGRAATSFTVANNDRTNVTGNRAGLSALNNNGGPTNTHALFAGSPAIDGGDPAIQNPPVTDPPTANPTDQRGAGFDRVINNRVDIGAFEKQNNNPIVNPVITPRNPTTNQTITVNANSDTTDLTYTFFVDGNQRQSGPQNTFDLSRSGNGNRGQTVSVEVLATNLSGETTGTDSVIVANTTPSFRVVITVTNPAPYSNDTRTILTNSVLKATPSDAVDADNDRLTYSYAWKVNGQVRPQERGSTIDLSKPGNGDRDDVVSVEVKATDGAVANTTTATKTARASVKVGNTRPVPQNVSFNVNAGQRVQILLQASDVDTKQATRTSPAVDTMFRFELKTEPKLGTALIRRNSDGRYILTYTANENARGNDTVGFLVNDQATSESGAQTSLIGKASATIIAAPAKSTSSPATAQSSNPSGGSS